jgi:hypothetical protein
MMSERLFDLSYLIDHLMRSSYHLASCSIIRLYIFIAQTLKLTFYDNLVLADVTSNKVDWERMMCYTLQ